MPCHGECSAICVSVVTQLLCPGIFESGKTKLKEEVWKANLEMEQMVLQHCPAGHEKVTSSTVSSFGVATVNKTFDHDSQQCRKCEDNEYIVNPDRDECTVWNPFCLSCQCHSSSLLHCFSCCSQAINTLKSLVAGE